MDVFVDSRFESVYRDHPIVLVDVGARGGLRESWLPVRRHLHLIGFEPDRREFEALTQRASEQPNPTTFFDVALFNRKQRVELVVARDHGLSSVFEPDRDFLNSFPDAARFDIVDRQEVEADALDNLLSTAGLKDIDFLKVDTQGSELHVLEGAAETLASSVVGVEVEAEFTPIYKGQPVFADVDALLRHAGYLLFDLRPCYWKRAVGQGIGGPYGQIIWADALYLRSVAALHTMLEGMDAAARKGKLMKAISISVLYGYLDYALEMLGEAGAVLTADESDTVERRLREEVSRGGARLPGRRWFAGALHRLWKLCAAPGDVWSVSRAKLGNLP